MYFSENFPCVDSKLWKAILFFCMVSVASTSRCFSSANVICDCDNAKVECSGVQTYISEVQDILKNFTSVSSLIIKVNNLQFEPNFRFGTNMNVTNLTLGYDLQTPPSDFLSELGSSLIILNLQNNSIKLIDNMHFSSLASLNELFLDMNQLNELESSMFANLLNLKYLSLASNDFHEVASDTFQNLPSLETLVLSYNNLSLFQNVNIKSSSLFALKVDGCEIQGSLEKDTFSELHNLEELDLAYNKLSEVKPNSLSSLKNLKYLNLSHNVIQFLQENAFIELNNLTYLDLKSNKISIVKTTSFANLLNLEYLDLSRNKLKAFLCEYTTAFSRLEKMYLQDNEIKTFTTGAFYYSPLLKELDITGNHLECSCELTDMSLYLIDNSTMEKEDLDSVFCIIPSTHDSKSITNYRSSKCMPQEPCKKLIYNSLDEKDDDDDYDYPDYSDASVNLTTGDITSTTTITSRTTLTLSTEASSEISTEINTHVSVPFTRITTDSLIASSETTANSPLISTTLTTTLIASPTLDNNTAVFSSVPSTSIESTDSPATSTSAVTSTIAPSTLDNDTAVSTTIPSTTIESTDTSTDSPVMSISEVTSTIQSSTSHNDSFSDLETTIVSITTEKNISYSIATTTEVANFTFPTTTSMPNDNLTALYSLIDSVPNSGSEQSTIYETTTAPSVGSGVLNDTIITTLSVTNSATEKPLTASERISTVLLSTPKQSCSSLELSLESLNSDPELVVIRNFSYDDTTFCLKWTIGGAVHPKRCILKYSFNKGTKSENVKCPSFAGEVNLWTKNEKVIMFCIDIIVDRKRSFCGKVFEKTTLSDFGQTTTKMVYPKSDAPETSTFSTDRSTESSELIYTDTSAAATKSIDSFSEIPIFTTTDASTVVSSSVLSVSTVVKTSAGTKSTDIYSEIPTFTATDASTIVSSNVPSVSTTGKTPAVKYDSDSTKVTLVSYPAVFNVTSFDVFFNDSSFAYVKWTVNKEEPFNLCNLSLTATTQYFVHHEGVFPCKKRTHQLENVREDDIFQICLSGIHIPVICRYSLAVEDFDAEASKDKDYSSSNHNGSLIPLICLLILLVIIVMFIIFKNLYRKKLESDRYDVRAEEEKSQRVEIRPISSHDRSSVRYSYIAKENPDI